MRFLLSAGLLLLLQLDAASLYAQRATRRTRPRVDTPSVVLVPKSQQQVVDTALLLPEEQRTPRARRKFRVMVVPAPPPGRTRQDILYSDSLGRQRP